jgi:hypothetical protein
MNVDIQFNANVIEKLKEHRFNNDQLGSLLFILFCLYEHQIDLLDKFDDSNRAKRVILLYKELEVRGLIQEAENAQEGSSLYELTKEGIDLVDSIKAEFKESKEEIAKEELDPESFERWIRDWVNLFPRGVRTFGKLVRSDKETCKKKMKAFMLEYNYSRETIMEATKKYIEVKREQGWNGMRCAVYFIWKQDPGQSRVSDLADYCAEVMDSENDTPTENNLEIMV